MTQMVRADVHFESNISTSYVIHGLFTTVESRVDGAPLCPEIVPVEHVDDFGEDRQSPFAQREGAGRHLACQRYQFRSRIPALIFSTITIARWQFGACVRASTRRGASLAGIT
jgi:hypothetical protein